MSGTKNVMRATWRHSAPAAIKHLADVMEQVGVLRLGGRGRAGPGSRAAITLEASSGPTRDAAGIGLTWVKLEISIDFLAIVTVPFSSLPGRVPRLELRSPFLRHREHPDGALAGIDPFQRPRLSSASCCTDAAASSTTNEGGITTAPSPSPTTMSPGMTVTPAQAIGIWCSRGMCIRPNVAACEARWYTGMSSSATAGVSRTLRR